MHSSAAGVTQKSRCNAHFLPPLRTNHEARGWKACQIIHIGYPTTPVTKQLHVQGIHNNKYLHDLFSQCLITYLYNVSFSYVINYVFTIQFIPSLNTYLYTWNLYFSKQVCLLQSVTCPFIHPPIHITVKNHISSWQMLYTVVFTVINYISRHIIYTVAFTVKINAIMLTVAFTLTEYTSSRHKVPSRHIISRATGIFILLPENYKSLHLW